MDKSLHPPFHKKGDFRIAKKYRSINLAPFSAKNYNALLLNCIESEILKTLRKSQIWFSEKNDLQYHRF